MTTVEIDGDYLRVRLTGWDRVWALKGEVDVPLSKVRDVAPAPAGIWPRGLRVPGTYIPGLIMAGTYRWRGRKEFWSVRDRSRAIVVDLDGDGYTRLVLQVADPEGTIAAIRGALARRGAA